MRKFSATVIIVIVILFSIVTVTSYAFSPATNKSLNTALVKICTNEDGPLVHSYYDDAILVRGCPHSSSFIVQNIWKSVLYLDYMVAAVGQFSQGWLCVPQSSD